MMKKLSQLFFQGLIALLPIILTITVLYWLGSIAESTLGKILKWLLPDHWYWPGMGILVGVAIVFAIGVLMNAYLFRQLANLFDRLMNKIPLVKIIYSGVRDIAKFASLSKEKGGKQLQKTVLVRLTDKARVVGFITNDSPPFSQKESSEKMIAVYIPMSYQVGGFTIIVPESNVDVVDMSVQEAMRFILTAGMTVSDPV
jgi:uncharacterized membrane protein